MNRVADVEVSGRVARGASGPHATATPNAEARGSSPHNVGWQPTDALKLSLQPPAPLLVLAVTDFFQDPSTKRRPWRQSRAEKQSMLQSQNLSSHCYCLGHALSHPRVGGSSLASGYSIVVAEYEVSSKF